MASPLAMILIPPEIVCGGEVRAKENGRKEVKLFIIIGRKKLFPVLREGR